MIQNTNIFNLSLNQNMSYISKITLHENSQYKLQFRLTKRFVQFTSQSKIGKNFFRSLIHLRADDKSIFLI